MGRLIYSAIVSLDGYHADAEGNFDWAEPDAEVHAFLNALEQPIGTHLYGRRVYETMAVWDTMDLAGEPPEMVDFAESWRAVDKVVYSRTLTEPTTRRTRIEPEFEPDAVRALVAAAPTDVLIGGPELAGVAMRAGLVDEWWLFLHPIVIGGGSRALPDDARIELELTDERRFASGVVFLRYARRAS